MLLTAAASLGTRRPALQRLSLPAICQFPARNARLKVQIAKELAKAEAKGKESRKPERMFKELRYRTRKTWSRERRVVAKAEHLPKGANPRFIVTSLIGEAVEAQELYKKSTAPKIFVCDGRERDREVAHGDEPQP